MKGYICLEIGLTGMSSSTELDFPVRSNDLVRQSMLGDFCDWLIRFFAPVAPFYLVLLGGGVVALLLYPIISWWLNRPESKKSRDAWAASQRDYFGRLSGRTPPPPTKPKRFWLWRWVFWWKK